ncbi:MAG TPA: magnesium-translocating P-type ATPase [Streptosporangiaceae bacterium]|nr:magnesium-translocating P-type ATPase [Streptosporangiaceae bacterium]
MTSNAGTVAPSAGIDLAAAAALPPQEVLQRLGSSNSGLSDTEAADRLKQYGSNLVAVHRVRALAVLWGQLRNPLLLLLLAAAAVSGLTGDPTDAIIIAVIVALSVGLGFVNEYRAAMAVEQLHDRIRRQAVVWRDGRQQNVDVTLLVPGDVAALQIGDIVPADIRLLEADQLETDESVLTGESLPVSKDVAAVAGGADADLSSCVFMGTIVQQGSGRGVVVGTGASTAFGKIASGLADRPPKTGFQVGLSEFSKLLAAIAVVVAALVFIINVVLGRPPLQALLFSLAIAVGLTPELFPAIVSVSLSAGSRALAKRHVLVKRLVAIEDLGNIQVLFTDKTGTLTDGAITFSGAIGPDGKDAAEPFRLGLLDNEASMTDKGPVGGNPLDQALLRAAGDTPGAASDGGSSPPYRRLAILPFDHKRQMSSVLVTRQDRPPVLISKGAPEAVFARCKALPEGALATLEKLFADGERVVAVATRDLPAGTSAITTQDERQLTLAGFLTFADRPKPDAGAAVAQLSRLGVDVKIITGDNGVVAAKVCREIGIEVAGVMNGTDLAKLDDERLAAAIPGTTVFARISPDQKSRIITVARGAGKDVAFMGDGVNDAVAIHHADVGISVDSATDVAKDAADVVLLEKDLDVLATGVMEGRRIFANTMKYVLMATSSNFGNIFSAAGASLFLSFLPLLPSQILLNNLLYDTGQLAIPADNVDPEALARPAAWDIKFVRQFMYVFGPLSSVFDFITFWALLSLLHAGPTEFRSGWFVESIATQTLIIYVIRTRRIPFFRSRPSVPMMIVPTTAAAVGVALPFTALGHVLGFTPLPVGFFLVLVVLIVAYLVLVDVAKFLFYRAHDARPAPSAQPPPPGARPVTDRQRSARRLGRRAAPFTAHRLTAPGRWLVPRGSSNGAHTKAQAGQADAGDRAGATGSAASTPR